MRLSLREAWRRIFSPETLVAFVIASLTLSVIGIAIFAGLINLLGSSQQAVLGIILVGGLLLGGEVLFVAQRLRYMPNLNPREKGRPHRHQGLILLVSKEVPCWVAIRYHEPTLKYCWLLHSNETATLAYTIGGQLESQGKVAELRLVKNVLNPTDRAEVVGNIYDHLPPELTTSDVICDFTGMTCPASVGAVLASVGRHAPLQYTPRRPDTPDSDPPIEVILVPASAIAPAKSGSTRITAQLPPEPPIANEP